jgi:predicted DNA-binding transcriptional regulator YafY
MRIFKIHHCLRTMNTYSAEELATACEVVDSGINVRRIREDLQFLRDMGASIPKGNKHAKFRYEKAFSLLETLEGVKMAETDEVVCYLNQLYEKAPKAAFLELDKVFLAMEKRMRTADAQGDPFLQFEKREYRGQDYIATLLKYTKEKRTIEFTYEPFERPASQRTVFPVFLKEYNHRWFLIGYDQERNAYQNYALDRIISQPRYSDWKPAVEELPDPTTYFKELIGVTMEGKVERIVVRVKKQRAYYIRTKPWHASQEESNGKEGWVDFTWTVYQNRELITRILELGADAEVLEPDLLRKRIRQTLRRAMEKYEDR